MGTLGAVRGLALGTATGIVVRLAALPRQGPTRSTAVLGPHGADEGAAAAETCPCFLAPLAGEHSTEPAGEGLCRFRRQVGVGGGVVLVHTLSMPDGPTLRNAFP